MITMALAQMLYFVALQAPLRAARTACRAFRVGAVWHPPLQNDMVLYYVVLAVVVAAWLLIARIVHSPFGQILKAIRENETRTTSLGYDIDRFKLVAFVLSAWLAGLAGSLKALVLGFATLTDVHWATSGSVILMSLIGGIGTLSGPVVGAFVITGLENVLADRVGSWVTVILGVIFVVSVLLFRQGLVGTLREFLFRSPARAALQRVPAALAGRRPDASGRRSRDRRSRRCAARGEGRPWQIPCEHRGDLLCRTPRRMQLRVVPVGEVPLQHNRTQIWSS